MHTKIWEAQRNVLNYLIRNSISAMRIFHVILNLAVATIYYLTIKISTSLNHQN